MKCLNYKLLEDPGFLEEWIEKITVNPEVVKTFLLKLMPIVFDLVSVDNETNTKHIFRGKRASKRKHVSMQKTKQTENMYSRQSKLDHEFHLHLHILINIIISYEY